MPERDAVGRPACRQDLHVGKTITHNTWERIYGALCKLKDYEDTGLDPERVESLNTFDGSQGMKYLKLYQEEQRKHRWIPVSEQLPENIIEIATEEEYLRQTKLVTDGEAVTLMIYENGKFRDIIDRDDVYDCITAWMPLPESYRP